MADATPGREYESYGASLYVLTSETGEPEGPSLPFGFVRHQSVLPDLEMSRDRLPEPWMWWQ